MTRSAPNYRDRRRELARELADVPTPPPPADLLDAIRGEIPADLTAVSEPALPRQRSWWRSRVLALAASIAFVAVGAAVVLRNTDRPEISGSSGIAPSGVATETRPISRPAKQKNELEQARDQRKTENLELRDADDPRSLGNVEQQTLRGAKVVTESDELPVEPRTVEEKTAGSITVASEAPTVDKFNSVETVDKSDVSQSVAEPAPVPIEARLSLRLRQAMPPGRDVADATRLEAETIIVDTERDRRSELRRDANAGGVPAAPPSTGGTVEPNDAPVGDMFFRSTGVNPFVDTREDRLSTFALDVDTGSWSLARSYLERGSLPPAEAIRVEEFVNAQEYDDQAPRRGDFTLVAEGAPSPFASPGDYRLVRFAVKGRELAASQRKPAVLTFVVDVSGSMAQQNRLGMVKHALGLLLDELAREDRVGLVVYGSQGRVMLEHTSDHEQIRRAIDSLQPEGSTNAEEGLRLGYDLAGAAYRSDWNNRVVLCSDGVANVGATGPESILERIGREARRGIELTTVGFGMGNYNDALMEQLADQGDGRYHYVDTPDEARRIFVADLSGTLETIAEDAKVQVELDPSTVERWRLLGYENRDVADRDFRNDRVDAGEIGAGHSATALYEIRLAPGARRNDTVGTLRLRWKSAATGNVEEAALTLHVRDLSATFDESSDNLRRAAVAAELAETLKGSFYAKEASWRTLRAEADRLERISAPGHEPDALLTMIVRAGELSVERVEETDERDQ